MTRLSRFKMIRLERGLRQIDIARVAGVAEGYVSRIETERVTPSRALLERLAAALGVTVEYLAGEDDRGR
ncbi:MAG TPA: helix-turn-helix transcriptional regulator [Candidatus Krumholzibacteria bacterium]|nr:helix-turn-helix transcriptional regulator [Candidatus Krumholzibacteria bacterium]